MNKPIGFKISYRPRKSGKYILHELALRKNGSPYWKALEKLPKKRGGMGCGSKKRGGMGCGSKKRGGMGCGSKKRGGMCGCEDKGCKYKERGGMCGCEKNKGGKYKKRGDMNNQSGGSCSECGI